MAIGNHEPIESDFSDTCECPWCGGSCNTTGDVIGELDLRDIVPFDIDQLDSEAVSGELDPARIDCDEVMDLYLFRCSDCGAKFPLPA